jgi:hypothetical protein
MGLTEPMVNIRMKPDQLAAIDAAAHAANLVRAVWGRELLLAAARSTRSLDQITELLTTGGRPDPKTPAALGAHRRLTGRCLHPVHLISRYATRDVCTCGTVVARR